MLSRLRISFITLLAAVLVAAGAGSAQAPTGRETSAASVASFALTDQMPVDPEATVGKLPNGLRYYVRQNGKPGRRAELRLVVRAGSVLEDEDQRGLAHFVEHMEFEGTTHFPKQGISDFLSSLGLSIGPDANAETSYDSTEYTIRVPTDVPGVLDRALLVLEDWTHAAVFEQSGIERQRGIVLAEWRRQLGAVERTQDKIRRTQLEGSRYADRVPIGNPDIIEHAMREPLLRFYRDWYRPDLMAVIVVGDIDRNAVIGMIRDHFSGLTNPNPERPRPAFDVPEHQNTKFAVVTDKESTATVVEVSDLRPARDQGSVGGYREIMLDQLFADMLGARLDELSQTANPPFLRAGASRRLFETPKSRDEASLQALVAANGVARGLDALLTELRRVALFGFRQTELTRAEEAMMLRYERSVTESPDRESASRADEYTRNFMQDEALPTIWQELAFHRRFIPTFKLEEVNALAGDWFPEANRLVLVSAPEGGVALPSQAQLATVVRTVASKKLEAYVDSIADQMLMDAPPARGSIVRTNTRAESGITEWTLSNGATVVLKPTKLKEDQILFRAFAPGGTSLASDADFPAVRVTDAIIPAGGVGRFNGVALDRLIGGKAVAVSPFIGELNQGMAGGSTPQDLELMFQLLYLRFTQPRADPNAFASVVSQAKALLANQNASPEVVFGQAVASALNNNHPRRRPETLASVDQWNLAKSLAFYKARFADASNFTFVFTGSFTVDMIKPFVETYVASLPATHAQEKWRDLGINTPTTIVDRVVEKGIAPKSEVSIVFAGPIVYDDAHLLALRTMTLILQSRLLDVIRQELGGTYSITATPSADKAPRPTYRVRIEWTCDPARTSALVQRVFDEIDFVKSTSYSTEGMKLLREGLLRDFERNSEENGYVLNQIARHYEDGDPDGAASIVNMPQQIAALTPNAIQQAARTYLNTSAYVKVALMPESKK